MQVAVYWAVDPDILCTSALLTESIRPIYPSGYDDCLVISVVIGKEGPFIGDPVQVRGLVAHHPLVVGTDVPVADVIAHDGKNIGLGGCCGTTSGGH